MKPAEYSLMNAEISLRELPAHEIASQFHCSCIKSAPSYRRGAVCAVPTLFTHSIGTGLGSLNAGETPRTTYRLRSSGAMFGEMRAAGFQLPRLSLDEQKSLTLSFIAIASII